MLKVATVLPHEPYREYKDVERVYSGSTEIDKILDKNGNVLFAVNKEVEGTPALTYKGKEETNLKNYRIYGNTETKTRSYSGSAPLSFLIVDGAVSNYRVYGQTSRNLFDETIYNKNVADNTVIYVPMYVGNVDYVTCSTTCPKIGDSVYDGNNSRYIFFISGSVDAGAQNTANGVSNGVPRTIPATNGYVTIAYRKIESHNIRPWEYQTMLNVGSTALPYEPYGESVGDRTENLWDENYISASLQYKPIYVGDGFFTLSTTTPNAGASGDSPAANIFFLPGNVNSGVSSSGNGCWIDNPKTVQSIDGYVTIAYKATESFGERYYPWNNKTMLNVGSTALPYEPYGYRIPIANNSETANIYLDEPLRKVGDEAEYVDYTTQKQHKVRKNLLKNTARSQTINGVTFTVNNDGSVTCNGTASVTTYLDLNENFNSTLYAGMKASFYQSGQQPSINAFRIRISKANRVSLQDFTMNDQVIADHGDSLLLAIRIQSGYTCDNLTFYPMIRKADITDGTYEPYIENTEVDVTLPALPAQSSTNSLSVGTTIQPSSVAVDVGEIVSCGDKVTDSQSVNYGKYKIPVTLTAGSAETTDIYLDTPLAKSGNNADYIDYATQKRHNSDGTESSVTLPEIAVTAGTNTLTVGTEVQPSNVYMKGRIKEAS